MQVAVRFALLLLIAFSAAVQAAPPRALGHSSRGGAPCVAQVAICTVSAPVFAFGRHPMSGSIEPILAPGSITVSCDKIVQQGTPVTITFDLSGLPPSDPRQLSSGQGAQLDYAIYLDPTRTRVWGDGTRGTETISDILEMQGNIRTASRTYQLYGKVNGGQPAVTGAYLNAINAEMRYGTSCN